MKTTISIIVCLLFFSSKACDMCGGVSGNASIGLFAANQFHYLGLRSNFRDYSLYMHGIRQADQLLPPPIKDLSEEKPPVTRTRKKAAPKPKK